MAKPRIALLRSSNVLGLGQRLGKAIFDKYGNVTPYMLIGKRGKKRAVYAPNGIYILWHFSDWQFPHYKELGNDPTEALEELKRAKKELKTTGFVRFQMQRLTSASTANERLNHLIEGTRPAI
jgi:hypothetical protein